MAVPSKSARTLTRQHLMRRKALEREFARAPGRPGHAAFPHALRVVKLHLTRGASLFDALNGLENITGDRARDAIERMARKIIAHLTEVRGLLVESPKGFFESPNGIFQITASPDLTFNTDESLMHIVFWTNTTQELYGDPAAFMAALYLRALPPSPVKKVKIRTINVVTGKEYDFDTIPEDLNDQIDSFLSLIERLEVTERRLKNIDAGADFSGYPDAAELALQRGAI
jgi:hypothetical protein